MKKKRALFFLYLSLAFMMGHLLTPHQHRGIKSYTLSQQHQHQHCSIYTILNEVITRDLGHNHLEDYDKDVSDVSFSKIFPFQAVISPDFPDYSRHQRFEIQDNIYNDFIIKISSQTAFQKPLRAPPLC
jgi:hypothetical protein